MNTSEFVHDDHTLMNSFHIVMSALPLLTFFFVFLLSIISCVSNIAVDIQGGFAMYTLYYSPGACSLATHTILNLLGHQPELVYAGSVENFEQINSSKMVPVLQEGNKYLTEGAAIILHLLDKHDNDLLPKTGELRQKAIQNMMMANASMHPAYGRLFFANANLQDGEVKEAFFRVAAEAINTSWQTIENKLNEGPYLGGGKVSPADILLAVYARWGEFFPVDINIGPKAQRMIYLVVQSDEFQLALQRETEDHKTHAA